jgi:putative phage-type endonuclease
VSDDKPDRTGFLGSSDSAAILGVSPYKTPLALYLEKTGEGDPEDENRNLEAKKRGKRLEPYICDMLEEEGIKLAARNVQYWDAEHPFLGAQIDAETVDGRNVEIKTVHPFASKDWGAELTDSIPLHYTAQAMHGLMVSKREQTVFAVLIGDDLRIYKVDADYETIAGMREREVKFWNENVLAKVPPPAINSSDVLRVFAKDLGTMVEASEEVAHIVRELKDLKRDAKSLEREITEHEEAVKLAMGGAATLTYQSAILATWNAQTSRIHDAAAFATAAPGLVELFKRDNTFRVLRIK